MSQQVNNFIYFGRVMRHAVKSFLMGNGFNLPAFSLNVGFGIDAFAKIKSAFADPFNLPAVLCPVDAMEYLFMTMVFVRVLACAFTFSFYCLQRGNSRSATLVAALCYAFSGYVIFMAALRQPFFLTTAVYFPLVLIGADRLFRRESPMLLIVAMALQFLASTYYAYMVCIALLVYCLITYFITKRNRSIRDFAGLTARFAIALVTAFALASIQTIDKVISIGSQGRLGVDRYHALFYELRRYLKIPADLIGASVSPSAFYIGAVGLVAILLFLTCRKRFEKRTWIPWSIGLALTLLCACLPFLGSAMNGFAYATPRWMFIASFCFAYIVCLAFPKMRELNCNERRQLAGTLVAYAIISTALLSFRGALQARVAVMLLILAIAAAVIIPLARKMSRRILSGILSLLIVANITACAAFYFMDFGENANESYKLTGTVYETVFGDNPATTIESTKDKALFRYSMPRFYSIYNSTLNRKASGIDYYNSMYIQSVDDLRTELKIADDFFNIKYAGSDSRLAIDALTGAKYYSSLKRDAWRIPASYERAKAKKGTYIAWRTDHSLPLAFSTSFAIPKSTYADLSAIEKQEALLQGIVVDDDRAANYPHAKPNSTSQEVAYTITHGPGATIEDGAFSIWGAEGATVTISFDGLAECETYIGLENLDFERYMPSQIVQLGGLQDESQYNAFADLLTSYPESYEIDVQTAGKTKAYTFGTNRHPQYGGKHDWLINAGYSQDAKTEISLFFPMPGRYVFDDLSIICQPTSPLIGDIDALAQGSPEEISFDGKSTITAKFKIEEDRKIAVFTVPFLKGWTATIDGKTADVLRADTAFIGVEIEGEGSHVVELSYSPPNLSAALAITALGVFALISIQMVWTRRRKL